MYRRRYLSKVPHIEDSVDKIDLSYNKLERVSEDLFYHQCREIYLGYNKINSIDKSTDYFRNSTLLLLDLTHNNLKDLPIIIRRLSNLKILRASWNKLTSISLSLKARYIDLSYNSIGGELQSITHTNLTHFYISNNYLTGSIDSILECPNLSILDISNNSLTGSIDVISLTKLVYINCSNNLFSGRFRCGYSVEYINGNYNSFTDIAMGSDILDITNKLENKLEILIMKSNCIDRIPLNIPNIREIIVSGNNITNIALNHLSRLSTLDVSNNKIRSVLLPDKLKKLYIQSNELSELPDLSYYLCNLWIQDNRISGVFPNTNNLQTVICDPEVMPMRPENWDELPYGRYTEYKLDYRPNELKYTLSIEPEDIERSVNIPVKDQQSSNIPVYTERHHSVYKSIYEEKLDSLL